MKSHRFFLLFMALCISVPPCATGQDILIDSVQCHKRYANDLHLMKGDTSFNFQEGNDYAHFYFRAPKDSHHTLFYSFRVGNDRFWTKIGHETHFYYYNIQSGHTPLYIAGLDSSGNEILHQTIMLHKTTPISQSMWSIFILIIFLITVGAIISSFFSSQKARQKRKVDKMRSKIASDLHDEIGSTLGSIALLGEWTQKKIEKQSPETAGTVNPKLDKLIAHSRGVIEDIRSVIWAIDPEHDKGSHLIKKTEDVCDELLSTKNIPYEVTYSNKIPQIALLPDQNRQLIAFVKECVHNIAKHAQPSKVLVCFELNNNIFELSIEDDGVGFDTNQTYSGYGQSSLRERAKKLFAQYDLISAHGQGTKAILRFKLS